MYVHICICMYAVYAKRRKIKKAEVSPEGGDEREPHLSHVVRPFHPAESCTRGLKGFHKQMRALRHGVRSGLSLSERLHIEVYLDRYGVGVEGQRSWQILEEWCERM